MHSAKQSFADELADNLSGAALGFEINRRRATFIATLDHIEPERLAQMRAGRIRFGPEFRCEKVDRVTL